MSANSLVSPVGISDQTHTADLPQSPHVVRRAISRRLKKGGYWLAIISVLLAFLVRLLVDPWLRDQSPYLMFVVAVAVTGLYAGVRPAALAAALGTVVAYFCFVPPRYRWGFAGVSDAVGFAVYAFATISVILLTHARIRAAAKAEQSLKSQIEAERKLVDAETLFRHLMEHSSACAYLRDEDGHCVFANQVARREFGIEPNECHDSGRARGASARLREQDRQVLEGGVPMEFVDGRPGGERRWLTSKFPFIDQYGRRFIGGISFEITDRVRAEEILRKTERLSAAGQMASLLAHEINNPLAALTNVMYLLNQRVFRSPERELITSGTEALNRINRIASMTMGFFFDKGTPAPVRICEVIDQVAEALLSTERFKAVQFIRDFKCDGTVVSSSPRIKQLVASLLTNAMEAGATMVRVRVHVARDWRRQGREGVRMIIGDDGHGIRPELRKRLFEPFFSSKDEKGTGLGLWASKAIVMKNDGTIKLRSAVAGPRKGTSVCVFLPAAPQNAAVLV